MRNGDKTLGAGPSWPWLNSKFFFIAVAVKQKKSCKRGRNCFSALKYSEDIDRDDDHDDCLTAQNVVK